MTPYFYTTAISSFFIGMNMGISALNKKSAPLTIMYGIGAGVWFVWSAIGFLYASHTWH